ncbi:EAL domain-containing protein [Trichormus variabilis]|nr:EAL domain-containing protein [Trichormus variabilis]
MRAIAEGIKTPVQLEKLGDLGCDFGQGYLFSKLLAAKSVLDLLASAPQW